MPNYYPNYPTYGNYQPQSSLRMDTNYPVIKGRPVSSFEEARASMIDFDGTVFYFPDLANQKIYTKQINLDGTPSIKVYELVALPAPQSPDSNMVTKEEFETTIARLREEIASLKTKPSSPEATQSTARKQTSGEEFNF